MIKIVNKNKILEKKYKTKGGYSTLELLFYIAFFTTFSLIVINAMIVMAKSFKENSLQGEWAQSTSIMERISREIKSAYDISSISASDLKLNTKDSGNNEKTVEFVLSSGNLRFLENDVFTGNLNTSKIVVTGLTFTQITTTKGKAVKVVLSLRSTNDLSLRVQTFYDTIVLRDRY